MTDVGENLMAKAAQAVTSARLLLDAGDVDGACSRAYYAMFGAARAALLTLGIAPETIKTHAGVVGAFGVRFVKTGAVPRDVGRAINDVQEIRLAADYMASSVAQADAAWAVDQAERFVHVVRALLDSASGSPTPKTQ